VHALNDVTAVVEHTADVLGVHGASEVGIAVVTPVSTGSADSLVSTHQKFVADEVLGPGHAWVLSGLGSPGPRQEVVRTILGSSVASKFWKVVLNFRFSSEDFLSEQVLLVEEQDHGDGAQPSGREDALEEVQSLLQAVGLIVLPNDHVVAAAGHHEDNGSHICALDPFAALVTLATHGIVHLLEVDFVHLELGLKDSRSQDAANSAYLVTGHVVSLLDDIDLVQERGYSLLGAVNQLVLVGALIAGTHSFVLPQSLGVLAYGREVEVGHVHHAQNVVHSELVLRVGQLHGGDQVDPNTYFDGLFQVVFDVLHFGCLLTTVGLKRKRNHIASHWQTASL
uniref:Uncharacterized protein n=1 Tax=Felis catus TaxID=9685 RepID=A0ABI7WKA1_FELCA